MFHEVKRLAQSKKLQVFVSSTFEDLQPERQAAVEAILTAGHIPAGMELFAAGDQSQMEVIRRWIKESDAFLLILGGRYGSIEPKSQKSYIQLEYEYAVELEKPLFAVVIYADHLEEHVKARGLKAIETMQSQKLLEFKTVVESKMVRHWRDVKDIKLAILETLPDFATRDGVSGWVRADDAVNVGHIAEEAARLSRENAELRKRLANASTAGLSFDEMFKLLLATPVPGENPSHATPLDLRRLDPIVAAFGHSGPPALLHMFWFLSRQLTTSYPRANANNTCVQLLELGLIEDRPDSRHQYVRLSGTGRQFLARLRVEKNVSEALKHRM